MEFERGKDHARRLQKESDEETLGRIQKELFGSLHTYYMQQNE